MHGSMPVLLSGRAVCSSMALAWPLEVSSCFPGGEHEQEGSLDLGSSACGSRINPRTVALGWPFLQLPSASESAPALVRTVL